MTKDNSPLNEEENKLTELPMLDEDWLALTEDWQAQPYEKTDIQALLKQTRRRTLWAKAILILDCVATLGLIIALCIGLYQANWDNATLMYVAFGSLLSTVFVYYEIKIRHHPWKHSCDSPDKAIINAVAGCQSSIKYIKLIKLSCYFMLPAINCYIYVMRHGTEKPLWPAFLIINLFVFTLWIVAHLFHLKRSNELKQLKGLLSK